MGDNDRYEEYIELVNLVPATCNEEDITDALFAAGLIPEKIPRFVCNMEKLIYVYGASNEVYSSSEIHFAESIDRIYVYPDFFKSFKQESMICRVIAASISYYGYDAIKACVTFEKIVDKVFDGFNIFFFVTNAGVLFGCRVFNGAGKNDCIISKPIIKEMEFEQFQDELCFLSNLKNFTEFYDLYRQIIRKRSIEDDDYELDIVRKKGIQFSYLEVLRELERDLQVDMIYERKRYYQLFEEKTQLSFAEMQEEINDDLAFIKSNRSNTYEILFEADEMLKKMEATEAVNNKRVQLSEETKEKVDISNIETADLLKSPEKIIKFLRKRSNI